MEFSLIVEQLLEPKLAVTITILEMESLEHVSKIHMTA